jgi:hypothetical protein
MVTVQDSERVLLDQLADSAELHLAQNYFSRFLPFIRILEPPPGRGNIPFEPWPHLMEVCDILDDKKLLVWLKSRQTGASWLLAAYSLWMAQYHHGAVILLLSQGEEEAKKLLGKCKYIYEMLPPGLRVQTGIDSRQELTFPSMASAITALPSTEKAGRSITASLIIMDEADFHEYADASFAAVKPTIDDSGGQLIMVSTSNATSSGSLFKKMYREAPNNGFSKVFYGWNVRPGRDNAWYDERKNEYHDTALFEKEYPSTEEEALSPPRTISAFDSEKLNAMRDDLRTPIEKMQCGTATANIYQDFSPGKRYVAATDTAHGTGGDNAVTVVMDAQTGYVVADIMNNLIPPDQLGLASAQLLERYKDPLWAIEDNDWGQTTITTAQRIRYPRIFYRDEGKAGWHTDEHSRVRLYSGLMEAVHSRLIVIPNEDGLAEFYSLIQNPKKGGRVEAQQGSKDDYPLAVGMALQIRSKAQAGGRLRDTFLNPITGLMPAAKRGIRPW